MRTAPQPLPLLRQQPGPRRPRARGPRTARDAPWRGAIGPAHWPGTPVPAPARPRGPRDGRRPRGRCVSRAAAEPLAPRFPPPPVVPYGCSSPGGAARPRHCPAAPASATRHPAPGLRQGRAAALPPRGCALHACLPSCLPACTRPHSLWKARLVQRSGAGYPNYVPGVTGSGRGWEGFRSSGACGMSGVVRAACKRGVRAGPGARLQNCGWLGKGLGGLSCRQKGRGRRPGARQPAGGAFRFPQTVCSARGE
jgi:hypothetical protein